MVKYFTISEDQVGGDTINIPELAGNDILVSLRGLSFFDDSEMSVLPGGGFKLVTKKFVLGEKYTVIPVSLISGSSGFKTPSNIRQYPHTVKFYVTPDSARDSNGDWIVGALPALVVKMGRAEVRNGNNSANGFITGVDGDQVSFFCIVYLPLPIDRFPPGTIIEVLDGDQRIVRSTIKQFSKGQFNARIWV